MTGTQPYSSPDLMSSTKKDPNLEPVVDDIAERLAADPPQQVGIAKEMESRESDTDDPRTTEQGHAQERSGGESGGAEPGSVAAGADSDREISSTEEVEGRGDLDQGLQGFNDDEEASGLDSALEDTFPASDPPAQTSKG